MAILDSGCTKTVAGKVWMDEFVATLSQEDRNLVSEVKSKAMFRFGDGKEALAEKTMTIPVFIGNSKYMIESEIVDNEIPLLLSRNSMKTANMILNLKDDTARIGNKVIDLACTNTWHYCLPLTKFLLRDDIKVYNIILNTSNLEEMTKDKKRSKALKLHRQFSHATKERLIKLVRDSKEFDDKEFISCIKECCDTCKMCQERKRQPLRPIVSIPSADRFNKLVCMDLK